jgi:hypothetical protein
MPSHSFLRFTSVAAALVAAAACGPGDLEIPQPPVDLAPVAAVYDMPTATIDPARATEVAAQAQARLAETRFDWLPTLLAEALARLRERLQQADLATDPASAEPDDEPLIDAVLSVRRVCRGYADPPGPPDAAQNGTLELTAVIERGRLATAVWGTATACRARLGAGDAVVVDGYLNGTVTVYLQGGLPRETGDTRALVQVDGSLGTDQATADGSFDFRIIYPQLEFRLARPDGHVVVSVGPDALVLRASNASFVCPLPQLTCSVVTP